MAEKFDRKSSLRETWLIDMTQIVDELDNGRDAHSVDAAVKRHEAIHTDVNARVSCLLDVKIHNILGCLNDCSIRICDLSCAL